MPGINKQIINTGGGGGGGSGDVTGPASSTDNAVARYDGTTGKFIQNSSATIADDGTLSATSISAGASAVSSLNVNGTGGQGHIHLKHQSADPTSQASSTTIFADSNGNPAWINNGLSKVTLDADAITANRSYILPDASGTIALTSDISGTNLGYTPSDTNGIVTSDTGTDATIPLGNGTNAGLSLNDYTTAEKNKLAGIATGAEVNVNADWNAVSGDAQILNKPTIPTATSQLTNDSGFISSTAGNWSGTFDGQEGTYYLSRTNHTGTQTASTISDFASTARAETEAEIVAGANITITPSGTGATRQLIIASTGGGGGGGLTYPQILAITSLGI